MPFALIIVWTIFASACASTSSIPLGHGIRFGIETNEVVITNSTPFEGVVAVNGEEVVTMPTGDTETISLGMMVKNNVITFKTYTYARDGRKILAGVTTLNRPGGAGQRSEWTIRSIQPVRSY